MGAMMRTARGVSQEDAQAGTRKGSKGVRPRDPGAPVAKPPPFSMQGRWGSIPGWGGGPCAKLREFRAPGLTVQEEGVGGGVEQLWEAPAHPRCAEPSQLHQNIQH